MKTPTVVLILCGIALTLTLLLPPRAQADGEFRGIWVDAFHDGFKTPEQTTEMVNKVADANLNAIFVQVRKRGDAYYNSAIVRKADEIAPDYDALADVIQKAHAKGLEVHAWLSLIEVWTTKYGDAPLGHIYAENPDWATKLRGGSVSVCGGKIYLDPAHPDVRAHLEDVVSEIAQGYSVDGIHLGDFIYPSAASGHNETSIAQFQADCEVDAAPTDDNDSAWRTWRQDQLTELLRNINGAGRQARPSIKLSVAPRPELNHARTNFMQDWPAWLEEGLLDFVAPMNYRTDSGEFSANLNESITKSSGRHIYMGHGSWVLSSSQATGRLLTARDAGYPGFVLYSYAYLLGANSGDGQLIEAIKASVTPTPASVPAMPWKSY